MIIFFQFANKTYLSYLPPHTLHNSYWIIFCGTNVHPCEVCSWACYLICNHRICYRLVTPGHHLGRREESPQGISLLQNVPNPVVVASALGVISHSTITRSCLSTRRGRTTLTVGQILSNVNSVGLLH